MAESNWVKVETIIDEVLALPKEKHKEFIDYECGDDAALKNEITLLLESIFDSDGWLDNPQEYKYDFYEGLAADLEQLGATQSLIGQSIGSYMIAKELGKGGMGTVYLAERADGAFEHQVAIKVIHQHKATKENILRFEQERRILAGLNHTGIAKLLDGGITDDGFPYLIMEYIDGIPITGYCTQQNLSLENRINLFKKILEAVHHAHENAIIHRDLKPGNILVTKQGEVKILDFGISKMVDDNAPNHLTQTKVRLLTPRYAAPEQIKQQPITTATDLYALGTIFYQLLCGKHPFDLENQSQYEIEQIILNQEPSSPSAKVIGSLPIAKNQLKGDLDAIALKAIRKEPAQRYRTANEFLDDLDNYQHKLPVKAQEDSMSYRAQKFIKRHKQGVAVAAGILFLVIGFASFYTWQITEEKNRAELEAKKATMVTDFLIRIFESNDPAVSGGEEISAKELLDRGYQRIENIDNPAIYANMLVVIGRAYSSLGFQKKAENILDTAITKSKKVFGANTLETSEALYQRGLAETLNYDVALPYFQKAYRIRANTVGNESSKTADVLVHMASAMRYLGKLDSAEYFARNAIDIYKQNTATTEQELNAKGTLAYILRKKQKYKDSEKIYLDIIETYEQQESTERPLFLASWYNNLAFVYRDLKDYKKAASYLRKALKVQAKIRGSGHPKSSITRSNLAGVLYELKRFPEIIPLLNKNIKYTRKMYGNSHWRTASKINSLGYFFLIRGRYQQAMEYLQKSITIYSKTIGENHIWTNCTRGQLAAALYFQGKMKEADLAFDISYQNLKNRAQNFSRYNKKQVQKIIKIYTNKSEKKYINQIMALSSLLNKIIK